MNFKMKQPTYYDVFIKRNQAMLLVALSDRHEELWRRSDPGVFRTVTNLKAWKRQLFFHHT